MSRLGPQLVYKTKSQMNQKNFIVPKLINWGTFYLGMFIIRFISKNMVAITENTLDGLVS